jgi:uncharacterized protein (UPF0276 family)
MEFAVNYSPVLAELVREGALSIDRFKCPAWPELVAEARRTLPVYVHLPLSIGSGAGGPVHDERKAPADLGWVAEMVETCGTPLINTHLFARAADYPGVPLDSSAPRHIRRLVDGALRDLEPLIRRFGAARVTVENVTWEYDWLRAAVLPDTMALLLEETGCGFLFDLSHARIAARQLGMDERAYASALPVQRIREAHVTGLRLLEGALLERVRAATADSGMGDAMAGKWMDHFSMADADWPELEWMVAQISAGAWSVPWVMAFEIGGVGGFWEMVAGRADYVEQLPRMAALVRRVVEKTSG